MRAGRASLALGLVLGVVVLVAPRAVAQTSPADSLTVLEPNGRERWRIGSTQTIRWQSDGLDLVSIFFTPSLLQPFVSVVDSTEDDGVYDWIVPDVPTATARVLIVESDTDDFDLSDFDFNVLPVRGATASIAISSRPDAIDPVFRAEALEQFDLWILIEAGFDSPFSGVGDGLLGWEATLRVPESVFLSRVELEPDGALNLGVESGEFRVGLGTCIPDTATPFAVLQATVFVASELTDARFELVPTDPSTYDPPVVGWLSCVQPRELLAFDDIGNALLNPSVEGAPRLLSVFPNPSADLSHFRFTLPAPGRIRLRILDLRGRALRHLDAGEFPAGTSEVDWDGLDDAGRRVAAGVYAVELEGPEAELLGHVLRLSP